MQNGALILLLAGTLGWLAALLLAPLVPGSPASALTYLAGTVVCHQQPERSFHMAGAQLPVCARCFGLYAGAAAGALLWAMLRLRRRWAWTELRVPLAIVAAPTLVTFTTGTVGLWDVGNAARALLAAPLGAAAGAIAAAVAARDLR